MAVSKTRKSGKATSASDWKKAVAELPLLETPTGKFIRLKRPGMTKFLEDGFLPDSLAGAVRRELNAAKSKGAKKPSDAEVMAELTKDMDPDDMFDMLASMDRIVCSVMVEPKVVWHREVVREDPDDPSSPVKLDSKGREVLRDIPEEDRSDDVVYTDEIDQIDKNFIFQASVGGSTDLARFRAEQTAVMDALQPGEDVEEAPERAASPRP